MHVPFVVLACTALVATAHAAGAGEAFSSAGPMPADGNPSRVVATVGGQPITFAKLLHKAHSELQQQQSDYEARRRQLDIDYARAQQSTLRAKLDALIGSRLVELEATAQRTTELKVLASVKDPVVTDSEVRALYDARKLPDSPPFDQVKAQIRQGLEKEKAQQALDDYYRTLKAKYGVVDDFGPLRQQVAAVGPSRGPADAPVTVVEFGDYQCPFCHRLEPALESVIKQYSHQVRFVFRNFPLTEIHPEAMHAAEAAMCADQQGKFWPMHDAIYADSTPLSDASLRALAKQAGLDSQKFEKCVRSEVPVKTIDADEQAGENLGVEGTPTLFIDGRYITGDVPREQLVSVIQDELSIKAGRKLTASR
ncbi:MAG TPA: thioredoxin domain-containing protein [Steroidobacteraceae bacterium]|nr:thioredoxin domain-containing protein [Steroidobacteraceae bacterium]